MKSKILLLTLFTFLTSSGWSQTSDLPDMIHVKGSVYALRPDHPRFGNPSSVASVGEDGIFLADVGLMDNVEGLAARLRELSAHGVRYIVTTHHHTDHIQGLEYFSKNGSVVLIAPELQRELMSSGTEGPEMEVLPQLTFNSRLTIYHGDEEIEIFTFPDPKGHTGGDANVHFKTSNVLYIGDYVFLNGFPIIDVHGGGSVDGFFSNMKHIIDHYPDSTVIVPGHGFRAPAPIALLTVAGLRQYHSDLTASVEWIRKEIAKGASMENLQEQGLPPAYDKYHENYLYVSEKKWIKIIFADHDQH